MKPRLQYQPALDGVRALAVAMVLLFHGGVGWMRGGYIGVSVFFTLSGYLITGLLLAESDTTGAVRVAAFLGRRARRLLPASVVCIVAVVICSRYGLLDGVADLERDLLGATFQVQNWVLLASGESYTDVLATVGGQRSPLEHYWSLAIEEQFYWIWPGVFGWLVTRNRARLSRRLGAITLTLVAVAPLIAIGWGGDAAYWATPARLAEILLGAWLAVALAGRTLGREWARVAPPALGTLAVAAVVLPADGGPMYRGGLPLVGIASALLIVGLQRPSRLRGLLASRPFVGVGRISYGVYLFHWPVYVILDEARTDLGGPTLLGLRLAVTGLAATLSYVLVERPIRDAEWRPRRTLAGAALVTSAVATTALVVPVSIADEYWRASPGEIAALAAVAPPVTTSVDGATVDGRPSVPETGRATVAVQIAEPAGVPASTTTLVSTVATEPMRVVVVGDSTAESLGVGLLAWATANPTLADVRLAVSPGCGFVRGGEVATDDGVPFRERCDEILDHVLPATLTDFRPHVVVLYSTSRDLLDRRWSADEGTLDPFDVRYQQRIDDGYARISELVTASGASAVFVRGPSVDPYWLGGETMFRDPARRAIVDAAMLRLAATHEAVDVLDLRSWVEANGISASHEARPDGIHWAPEAALGIVERWVGPTLLSIPWRTP